MRIPESFDEYQHILNASGWKNHKKRKVGTVMRREKPSEFYGSLLKILENRIEEISSEISQIEEKNSILSIHKIRLEILKKQAGKCRDLIQLTRAKL